MFSGNTFIEIETILETQNVFRRINCTNQTFLLANTWAAQHRMGSSDDKNQIVTFCVF
jgi:hypothetical protein